MKKQTQETPIKCPYCGSTNTAEILYGMPAFSKTLEKKLASGKIHLGGCCIETMRTETGEIVLMNPDRYCNSCQKEFRSAQ